MECQGHSQAAAKAFLAPDIAEAILLGTQAPSLNVLELQGVAAYSWAEQRRLLRFAQGASVPVCWVKTGHSPVRVMSAPPRKRTFSEQV